MAGQGCKVSEVIDGGAKVVVTVAEGVGGVGDGVEAESALAHLSGRHEGGAGAGCVGDGDADGGGVVQIGGDDGGEGEASAAWMAGVAVAASAGRVTREIWPSMISCGCRADGVCVRR